MVRFRLRRKVFHFKGFGVAGQFGRGEDPTRGHRHRGNQHQVPLFRQIDGLQVLAEPAFDGREIATLGSKEIKPLRREMQMIFQDPYSSLNPRMTAGAIVAEPLTNFELASGDDLADRIAELLVKKHEVTPWWAQMLTVGYERARGLREVEERTAGPHPKRLGYLVRRHGVAIKQRQEGRP